MTRLVFMLDESEYSVLISRCSELRLNDINDCITWLIRSLVNRYASQHHTGFTSSRISSD